MLYSDGSFYQGHGVFMGHEPCPKCQEKGRDRAGNNLGRWEDGHAFCFSCSYREASTATKMLENALNATKGQDGLRIPKKESVLALPDDFEKTIDTKALQWLGKYGIMREEILNNDIGWSKTWEALIFPIKDGEGNLLAFQARRFRDNSPKWTTHGNVKDLTHIVGEWKHPSIEEPIVLVEDIVSAIRVGRTAKATPLFGSHIPATKIMRLRFLTNQLIFWLDPDKYADAIKASNRAELLGVNTKVIYSEKDPKEYADQTIYRFLKG